MRWHKSDVSSLPMPARKQLGQNHRMALLMVMAVVASLSAPSTGRAQQSTDAGDVQVTECDRLAGLTSDADHVGDGVSVQDLAAHAAAAAEACVRALKAEPNTRRFMTNLGLALSHLDRPAEAMDMFRRAADLGSSTAMNGIGVLHANGKGVPVDRQLAMDWFLKAADLGNPRAMVNLGISYSKRGPGKDMAQAMRWFRKAADSGDRDGILHVGLLYHGVGNFGDDDDWNDLDDKEALKWISKAADMGSSEAMYQLGRAHLYGHGVKKSAAKAATWFQKAMDAGNDGAKVWLESLCEWNKGLAGCKGK